MRKNEWSDALIKRHGEKVQRRLESSTVAICGLGGLGSNIGCMLARAGVGKLILIDFDKVDISNLHRQNYKPSQIGMRKTDALRDNLKEISPYITIETHFVRITHENAVGFIENADVICEAFDKPECKAMLTEMVLEKLPEKNLVAASGMAGMASANLIQTRRVSKRFYLCGDEKSDVENEGSLVSSRVMICAAHQAHMVLRILMDKYEV